MRERLFFCGLLFAVATSWYYVRPFSKETPQKKALAIERRIQRLEERKRGFEARALRHESLGNRLQFRANQYITAKRHWKIAEENRLLARKTQEEIAALREKKRRLLEGKKPLPEQPRKFRRRYESPNHHRYAARFYAMGSVPCGWSGTSPLSYFAIIEKIYPYLR